VFPGRDEGRNFKSKKYVGGAWDIAAAACEEKRKLQCRKTHESLENKLCVLCCYIFNSIAFCSQFSVKSYFSMKLPFSTSFQSHHLFATISHMLSLLVFELEALEGGALG